MYSSFPATDRGRAAIGRVRWLADRHIPDGECTARLLEMCQAVDRTYWHPVRTRDGNVDKLNACARRCNEVSPMATSSRSERLDSCESMASSSAAHSQQSERRW
jgi:hypothetical protein